MSDYMAGHRDRLRRKYLENSANLVYDYEVLELLLTYAIPRKDVKPIAKELLERFGSIEKVFSPSARQLSAIKGIGPNTAVLITLVKDIQSRCEKSKNENVKYVESSKSAVEYFKNLLKSETREKFLAASIDNSNRIISCRTLASGDMNHIDINPRDIIETVLLDNASRVIIAHNHPGGMAEPSAADIDLTLNVRNILTSVNVELSDHIIIGENSALSMRESYRYSKYFTKLR